MNKAELTKDERCSAKMSTRQAEPKATSRPEPIVVEVSMEDLRALRERVQAQSIEPGDWEMLNLFMGSYFGLLELLRNKEISAARLRKILFGSGSEKTKDLVGARGTKGAPEPPPDEKKDETSSAGPPDAKDPPKPKRKGHGRNGANKYSGAETVSIAHQTLRAGDKCPKCADGTVYDIGPRVLIRIVGQAPLQATRYELQRLRCSLCGELFTAQSPEGIGSQKYDATTGSMIAVLKYGSGLPFNRLRRLQGSLGIPLPAATQWDIVHAKAKVITPVFSELTRQAAQGEVVHNDDTTNKILEFMGKRAQKAALQEESIKDQQDQEEEEQQQQQQQQQQAEEDPEHCADTGTGKKKSKRTGLFTTGIVSQCGDRRIAVFLTGRQHCGENLGDVLRQRAEDLDPPIQMCDALSRNVPKELKTVLANCLVHGRRNFVEVYEYFRDECLYVLEALEVIYANDDEARKQQLSPEARLLFHQTHSGPTMDELKKWLVRQLDERLVEPNSGLGKAISYMLNHWDKLTLFLHKAGAPLDNNICERALKKVILHRKNSYFFKTQNGADVADLYTSLIYTCEINGINAFDYLTELERHADDLACHPERWMPWNYRTTLAELSSNATRSANLVGSPGACPAGDVVDDP